MEQCSNCSDVPLRLAASCCQHYYLRTTGSSTFPTSTFRAHSNQRYMSGSFLAPCSRLIWAFRHSISQAVAKDVCSHVAINAMCWPWPGMALALPCCARESIRTGRQRLRGHCRGRAEVPRTFVYVRGIRVCRGFLAVVDVCTFVAWQSVNQFYTHPSIIDDRPQHYFYCRVSGNSANS